MKQQTAVRVARLAEHPGKEIRNSCYTLRNPCYSDLQVLLTVIPQLAEYQELAKLRSIPKNTPIRKIPTPGSFGSGACARHDKES